MTKAIRLLSVLLVALIAVGFARASLAQERSLDVVVTYASGEVNESNVIAVTIFDNPTFQTEELDVQIVTENGGTASFSNVATSPVYVAAVYLVGGGDTGSRADVISGSIIIPSGTPAAGLLNESAAPKTIELAEGETVTVDLSFTNVFRTP